MPKAYKQLREITTRLEKHYKDVQDFEFTIQDERLFMLQTRSGKRTGYAAVVIATDLVAEKLVTPEGSDSAGRSRVAQPAAGAGIRSRRVEEDSDRDQRASGIARRGKRPGGVHGRPRRGMDAAGQAGDARAPRNGAGRHPRHVRRAGHSHRDRRHDVARRGGRTADGQAVHCRRGRARRSTRRDRQFRVNGQTVKEGDYVSFDGLSGEVKLARVASKPSEILQVVNGTLDAKQSDIYRRFDTLLSWADRYRRLGVRANADLPDQAELAYAFRRRRHRPVPHRAHVLRRGPHPDRAADDSRRHRSRSPQGAERAAAAAARRLLRRLQGDARAAGHHPDDRSAAARVPAEAGRADGGYRAAGGPGEERAGARGEDAGCLRASSSSTSSTPCSAIAASDSASPTRRSPRCRRARSSRPRAACNKEGVKVVPEIMIPLVGPVKELRDQKAIVDRVAAETMKAAGRAGSNISWAR